MQSSARISTLQCWTVLFLWQCTTITFSLQQNIARVYDAFLTAMAAMHILCLHYYNRLVTVLVVVKSLNFRRIPIVLLCLKTKKNKPNTHLWLYFCPAQSKVDEQMRSSKCTFNGLSLSLCSAKWCRVQ